MVVSQDLSTTNTYTLTVTRVALSADAYLASLVPSAGTLTPTFANETFSYTAKVPNQTTNLTVTPTAVAGTNATITVNGNAVVSGSASSPINLSVGSNIITIVVVSPDLSTTNTYTLTVTRTLPVTYTFTNNTAAGNYDWTNAGTGIQWRPVSASDVTVAIFSNTTTVLPNGTLAITNDPATFTLNTLTLNGKGAAATAQATVNIGTAGNTWTFDGTSPTININAVNGPRPSNPFSSPTSH